jgi:arylsulfatase A-like enzyme
VRWPSKIVAGTQVQNIASVIDLAPTLHALAGIKRVGEKPLDGRDLTPLLQRGLDADWAPRRIFNTWANHVSVRTQTHRLDNKGNLYDMVADPGQQRSYLETLRSEAGRLGHLVENVLAYARLERGRARGRAHGFQAPEREFGLTADQTDANPTTSPGAGPRSVGPPGARSGSMLHRRLAPRSSQAGSRSPGGALCFRRRLAAPRSP